MANGTADLDALDRLDPAPTSVRDVRKRMGWGAGRAAAALTTWRARCSGHSAGHSTGHSVPAVPGHTGPPSVELDDELDDVGPPGAGLAAAIASALAGGGPTGGTVVAALETALRRAGAGPEHAPTVALARHYAAALDDDPTALAKIGRAFLSVLTALRLTPHTRSSIGDAAAAAAAAPDRPRDELDELREEHETRAARRAAGGDPHGALTELAARARRAATVAWFAADPTSFPSGRGPRPGALGLAAALAQVAADASRIAADPACYPPGVRPPAGAAEIAAAAAAAAELAREAAAAGQHPNAGAGPLAG